LVYCVRRMDAWAARIRRLVKEYYQSDDAYCLQEGHGRFELVQYVANVKSDYRNLMSGAGRDTEVLPAVQPGLRGGDQFMMVFTYRPTLSHRVMDAVYGSFALPSKGSGASTTSSARRRHHYPASRDADMPVLLPPPAPAPAHVIAAAAPVHESVPKAAAVTDHVAVPARGVVWWQGGMAQFFWVVLWLMSILVLSKMSSSGGVLPPSPPAPV